MSSWCGSVTIALDPCAKEARVLDTTISNLGTAKKYSTGFERQWKHKQNKVLH